jgi:hypothetical protein
MAFPNIDPPNGFLHGTAAFTSNDTTPTTQFRKVRISSHVNPATLGGSDDTLDVGHVCNSVLGPQGVPS